MPPRGKAKPKKEAEENGKERQVRQSRNAKPTSYKDLSDSEDEKPIRKRSKKETDSESMSEEEKPKARRGRGAGKGKRAPARSRKVDVSDSDEASDFVSSDESSGDERKKKKGGRKPTRATRTSQNRSYKDLSDSEEESIEEDEDSASEKEEKSPPKRGRGRPAGKKSKKEESSEDEEEDEEEDEPEAEDESDAEEDEDEKDESKTEKPKSKPKSATADSSTDDNPKKKSDNKDTEDGKKKPRSDHELSDEEEGGDDGDDEDEKSSNKDNDEEKPSKKEKEEEKDSKKRKNGEAVDSKDSEPQAKKAKVEEKALLNKADTDYGSIDFTSEAKTKDGNAWNFKISSWNVAGLRAWIKKNGLDYIKHEKPDVLCLQETKCSEQKLPPEAKVEGYETYWLSGEKEGQAGVAIYSKTKPLEVKYGIDIPEFDSDGRVITAEYEKFYLVNTYVPNAGQGLKTLPRRLEWDPAFRAYLKKLDEKKPVILCGDLNVAHSEIDLANPKTNQKSAGFTPQEREGMTELLKEGFVDTFRSIYPDQKDAYSFWSYFNNARSRNTGWRLDYFITSERFLPNICDNIIRNQVYGSDHCPITLLAHV